jgi:hypothetical protein
LVATVALPTVGINTLYNDRLKRDRFNAHRIEKAVMGGASNNNRV